MKTCVAVGLPIWRKDSSSGGAARHYPNCPLLHEFVFIRGSRLNCYRLTGGAPVNTQPAEAWLVGFSINGFGNDHGGRAFAASFDLDDLPGRCKRWGHIAQTDPDSQRW